MREEEEKMRKLKEEGFAKRQELIQQGNEFKTTLQNQLKELEDKKQILENERSALEGFKKEF